MKRGISFSEYSLYLRDKKKWHAQYIKGEQYTQSRPQLFGNIIHDEIAQPGHLMRRLTEEGFTIKEKAIARKLVNGMASRRPQVNPAVFTKGDKLYRECEIEEGVIVLGFYDGLDLEPYRLHEIKTCAFPDDHFFGWNQWKVDTNAQPAFYQLIEYYKNRKLFSEILLHRLNTKKGTVKTFHTNRSRNDIETLKTALIHYANTLKKEGLWTQRKSREEIQQLAAKL